MDGLFRSLGHVANQDLTHRYPVYNIVKTGETQDGGESYEVEIAVAGFAKEDLNIHIKDNVLEIRGSQNKRDGVQYVHQGISKKSFVRTFVLDKDVEVRGADLVNGLLVIKLERIIPETKRSRVIAIGENSNTLKLVESEK